MKHTVVVPGEFPLEGGGTLHDVTVEVRTWGRFRKEATLICHALTGSADADEAMPNARFAVIDSPNGHDAFLTDTHKVERTVKDFLKGERRIASTASRGAAWA